MKAHLYFAGLHLACIARKLVHGQPIAFHVRGLLREIFPAPAFRGR